MIDKKSVSQYMQDIFVKTNLFNEIQLQWLNNILTREDEKDGIEQLNRLTEFCLDYLDSLNKKPFQDYLKSKRILQIFDSCLALYCKQKRIVVGVAQRKQYLNCLAPNLIGLASPQPLSVEVQAVFGMGYCEARTELVERALNNPSNTHILFIDDDVLVPSNIISLLISKNEPIIGANYSKKFWAIESSATYPAADRQHVFTNADVPFSQNMKDPIAVTGMGLGCVLVNLEVFKNIEKPWFKFDIENGKVKRGEDFYFFHKTMAYGYNPKIIPNLVCPHVDFKTGIYYGPEWLIDSTTKTLKESYRQYYTSFVCNPLLLANRDNDAVFGK